MHKTDMYIPNDYAIALASCLNDKLGAETFIPTVSVHPYKADALKELEQHAGRGLRIVKWLPNVMNIDPDHPKSIAFYKKLIELNMILLTHVGDEISLESEPENQPLGNPIGFKTALDMGTTIIMAHLGNHGENPDEQGETKSNFELFFGMLEEAHHNQKWKLYADISAVVFELNMNNLKTLFTKSHLWYRIIHGSDYPLPAVSFLDNSDNLADAGFFSQQDAKALREIYEYNPLLYDYVLKRTLRNPDNPGQKLPPEMFQSIFNKIN